MQHLESLAVLATAIAASGVDDGDILSTYTSSIESPPSVQLRGDAFRRLFSGATVQRRGEHYSIERHGVSWRAVIVPGPLDAVEVTL